MRRSTLIYLATLLVVVFACKKKTTSVDINVGRDYFPLNSGSSITYIMDSTIYDDFLNKVYTNTYLVKDIVDSSFFDLEGDSSWRIQRWIQLDSAGAFTPMYVYYASKKGNQLHVVEQNFRFIKMVFPATFTGVWNGNVHIATSNSEYSWLSDWRYRYADFGKPFVVNDTANFANTITVNQRNLAEGDTNTTNSNFGSYTFAKEIYAKNIGMVYRKFTRWRKDPSIGGGKRRGYSLEFRAIDWK